MTKTLVTLAAAGIVGLTALAAPASAQARPWGWGPGIAGGLIAGAALGTLAATASLLGPWYGPPDYGPVAVYAPDAYYDAYYRDTEPYTYGTTYAVEPAFYTQRFVRPAFGFWGGPRWHHRWHRF